MLRYALLVVAALCLSSCDKLDNKTRIEYRVGGTATRASLTYQNESGGTEQRDVTLPWSTQFTAHLDDFLYVSAQSLDDDSRRITCEIRSDGDLIEDAESEGRFVIASCSGSAD